MECTATNLIMDQNNLILNPKYPQIQPFMLISFLVNHMFYLAVYIISEFEQVRFALNHFNGFFR